MHAGSSPIVLGRSGDKRRDDLPDRPIVAGIPDQLHQVLACLDHIVQNVLIKADLDLQGSEAKLVLAVLGGTYVMFLFGHHCSEDLHSKISRLLSKPAFDLANGSERTERPR